MERRQVLQVLATAATSLWAAQRLSAGTFRKTPQDSPTAGLLLPLFPLELVLFPHVNLPLHIFEERYKEMIGDCLKNQWEFGILAVLDESVKPIGCTASISEVLERFPDGRMNILTRGRRRFEVSDLNEDRSYLRGRPTFFDDDEEASSLDDLPARAIELYDRLRQFIELRNEVFHEPRPTAADLQLSFRLMAGVPVDLNWQQDLLEMRSERERLTRVIAFLEQLVQHLEQYQKEQPPAGPVA
jgi:Lon protease-like protein